MTTLSGPMFYPKETENLKSNFDKHGAHYNIYAAKNDECGMAVIRDIFPEPVCDEYNVIIFSTSGVHGSYNTIEEIENSLNKYGDKDLSEDEIYVFDDYCYPHITFLILHPRIVCIKYGNAIVKKEDIEYLKKLRESSRNILKDL